MILLKPCKYILVILIFTFNTIALACPQSEDKPTLFTFDTIESLIAVSPRAFKSYASILQGTLTKIVNQGNEHIETYSVLDSKLDTVKSILMRSSTGHTGYTIIIELENTPLIRNDLYQKYGRPLNEYPIMDYEPGPVRYGEEFIINGTEVTFEVIISGNPEKQTIYTIMISSY